MSANPAPPRGPLRPLSVAPMMDWSDRHYRYFMRQITRHTLLYSEMITTGAILHGDREHLLGFSPEEKPLVLQIGGDDPADLAASARIAEEMGYDEVNLNVGCPSDRVQKGSFGACLMARPEVVAEGVSAMRAAVSIPVTVKHRIGIEGLERYEDMANFVEVVSQSGCDRFTAHARIAILKGLDPKANRSVPPLRYEDVHRLKSEFPHLRIEINGGIRSLEAVDRQLQYTDGVMLGRAAYEDPFLFAPADRKYFGEGEDVPSRREVVEAMVPYIARWMEQGLYPNRITRHILGLFTGHPGARAWRRYLSENAHRDDASPDLVLKAIRAIPDEVLDQKPAVPETVCPGSD